MWYFHDGKGFEIHSIDKDGKHEIIKLGIDIENGEVLQARIKGGTIFGSKVNSENDFGLVSCVVSPGFCYQDYELFTRAQLLEIYPQHSSIINELKYSNLPPGPINLPIIGGLYKLNQNDLLNSFDQLYRQYGKIIYLKFGSLDTIIISESEILIEAFIEKSDHFSERYQLPSTAVFGNNENIALSNGPRFTKIKSFLTSALSKSKIKREESMIIQEINNLLHTISLDIKSNNNIMSLRPYFKRLFLNTMLNLMLSKSIPFNDTLMEKDARLLVENIETLTKILTVGSKGDFIPMLRPFCPSYKEAEKCMRDILDYINPLINEHVKTLDPENPRDIVDLLVNEINNDKEGLIEMKSLERICFDLVSGGTDTISSTMEWMVLYLSNYPKYQEMLYEELKQNYLEFGRDPVLCEKNKYPVLNAVLKEVMRVATVAPLLGPHRCNDDVELGGYSIPKGSLILPNIYSMSMSPNLWDDPKTFNPSRFLNKDLNDEVIKNFNQLLIFGKGKRQCPGMTLAQDQLFLVISRIFRTLKFERNTPDLISEKVILAAVPFGQKFSGRASFYDGPPGFGACGSQIDAGTERLVAAPVAHWSGTPDPGQDPLCKNVYVRVTYNGKTITVPVKDKCPSCEATKIDLSLPAFKELANPDVGVIQITWEYVSDSTSPDSPSPSTTPSNGGGSCTRKETVKSGDSCWGIWTSRCNNEWNEATFKDANKDVNCNTLQIGSQICCGGSGGGDSTPSPPGGGSSKGGSCSKKETVKSGDSCWGIWTSRCHNEWNEATFKDANKDVNCNTLQIGSQICCGGSGDDSSPPSSSGGSCSRKETVKSGDSCWGIWTSRCKNEWNEAAFKDANKDVNCNALQIGSQVCCGGSGGGDSTPSPPGGGSSRGGSCSKKVTVKSGDSCWGIWTSSCNNEWNEATFKDANKDVNCNTLQIGSQICCGGSGGGDSTPSPPGGGSSTGGSCSRKETVKSGDSCWAIWTSRCNNEWNEATFKDANKKVNCDILQIGSQICCN
eukprot:gene1338-1689_t